MFEILGIPIQPGVSTGNVITWAIIIGSLAAWWIKGMPERKRAQNEADQIENVRKIAVDQIDNAEAAVLRAEFNSPHICRSKALPLARNIFRLAAS